MRRGYQANQPNNQALSFFFFLVVVVVIVVVVLDVSSGVWLTV